MLTIKTAARTALAKSVSALYTAASLPHRAGTASTAKTPATFLPVLRFAACSDIYLSGDPASAEAQRFAAMLETVYAYAAQQEYTGFDALLVAGDMTNCGGEEEYDVFNAVLKAHLRPETQLLVVTGNHEYIRYRKVDASQGSRVFARKMQRAEDLHAVINGFHFIGCSYSEDGRTFKAKLPWLEAELKKAAAESGGKPVFSFQHPAPWATIYGSADWGDADVPRILRKCPQTINFSGHSHYPVNDPRSIWQGGYTALGCGTLSYFETELDCFAGNFPYETKQAAQFYVVEADAWGNVRIRAYDLITSQWFDLEYYLPAPAGKRQDYLYRLQKQRDPAPLFPPETQIHTETDAEGHTLLVFTGAKDAFAVDSYKGTVLRGGVPVQSFNFSGKYMYLFEPDVYTADLGALAPGSYTASIHAMNCYAKLSKPLVFRFRVQADKKKGS